MTDHVAFTDQPAVRWGAATDVGPGTIAIDHYNVYRDGTRVKTLAGSATTFQDTALAASIDHIR